MYHNYKKLYGITLKDAKSFVKNKTGRLLKPGRMYPVKYTPVKVKSWDDTFWHDMTKTVYLVNYAGKYELIHTTH